MKLLLTGFITFALVTQIHAAGFDCDKAKTKIELTICEKSELSDLDSQMMQLYDSTLANAKSINLLKSDQKLWLKNIRNNCPNSDCLISMYHKRIEELESVKLNSEIQDYKISYLSNGKIRFTYRKLSKIFNLADHIQGCQGNLYDSGTNEKNIPSNPGIGVVSILKNPETTTLLLLITASPNCNIQGHCGAGTNNGFIALTITDKLNIVYLNSFIFDDCILGRQSEYLERFYDAQNITDMLTIIRPTIKNGQIKVEFEEPNDSGKDIPKQMIFDMKDPAKGFILEPSTTRLN